jgi:hypothetical protein
MAIALDRASLGTNNSGAATSLVITTSATAAAGSRIVVFVYGSTAVSGVTDTNGNTYAQDRTHTNTNICSQWSTHSASELTSGSTITVTYGSSSNPCMAGASSFTGVLSASAVDQVNSVGNFPPATAWNTSSITPTVSPSLVTGFRLSGGAAAATSTPDAGWTELHDFSRDSNNMTTVYQIVSDTAARNPSGVFSVSQSGAIGIGLTVNYKEADDTGVLVVPPIRRVF